MNISLKTLKLCINNMSIEDLLRRHYDKHIKSDHFNVEGSGSFLFEFFYEKSGKYNKKIVNNLLITNNPCSF